MFPAHLLPIADIAGPLLGSFLAFPAAAATATSSAVVSVPNVPSLVSPSVSQSLDGCGVARSTAGHWNPHTGVATNFASGAVRVCKQYGAHGESGDARVTDSLPFLIPFRVTTNGSRTVETAITVGLATVHMHPVGGCPAERSSYHPPALGSSTGECSDVSSVTFEANAFVVDLGNPNWFHSSFSEVYSSNYLSWSKATTCFNSTRVSCTNSRIGYPAPFNFAIEPQGFSAFTWNGRSSFVLFTNCTKMHAHDRFGLMLTFSSSVYASARALDFRGTWTGHAVAAIDLANVGHAGVVNSVTVT